LLLLSLICCSTSLSRCVLRPSLCVWLCIVRLSVVCGASQQRLVLRHLLVYFTAFVGAGVVAPVIVELSVVGWVRFGSCNKHCSVDCIANMSTSTEGILVVACTRVPVMLCYIA
jgi:hypothetical protein